MSFLIDFGYIYKYIIAKHNARPVTCVAHGWITSKVHETEFDHDSLKL
jgi:hypothetical protein